MKDTKQKDELKFKYGEEIRKASINGKPKYENKIHISKNADGYFFLYHSFHDGRWYDTEINKDSFKWDHEKYEITYVVEKWSLNDFEGPPYDYNVPVIITFYKDAFDGFVQFLNN